MDSLRKQVLVGLSAPQKFIPSSFFYDDLGSSIYQKITACKDYYLIRSEIEILENHKTDLIESCDVSNKPFELIDLGAGDSMKTSILINECLRQMQKITYVPVDISSKFIKDTEQRFKGLNLPLKPQVGNYFDILPKLKNNTRKIFCFLGSNIGNFTDQKSVHFLKEIRKVMLPEDVLLIGCDLVKDPEVIIRAYNDRDSYTKEFNLNMLARLNREFGGDIQIDNFTHYPIFDPLEPAAKSFLISKFDQIIHLKKFNKAITFHKWEQIHTETSRKYTPASIRDLAIRSGLTVKEQFFCSQDGYEIAVLLPTPSRIGQENEALTNFKTISCK